MNPDKGLDSCIKSCSLGAMCGRRKTQTLNGSGMNFFGGEVVASWAYNRGSRSVAAGAAKDLPDSDPLWNRNCSDNECGACVHGCMLFDDPTGKTISENFYDPILGCQSNMHDWGPSTYKGQTTHTVPRPTLDQQTRLTHAGSTREDSNRIFATAAAARTIFAHEQIVDHGWGMREQYPKTMWPDALKKQDTPALRRDIAAQLAASATTLARLTAAKV
jgi:hypothetical protein